MTRMKKEKIYLVLQSAACILLAVVLIAGVVGICLDGLSRRAEDPAVSIFTPELVAERLGPAVPLFFVTLGLAVAGVAMGVRDPNGDKPLNGIGTVKPAAQPKHKTAVQIALVAMAIVLIIAGILNGSAWDVLVKAINICTECVGLG